MTVQKIETVDLIEVVENGIVQVRTRIDFVENHEIIASRFHRSVVRPGQDYNQEHPRVQAICSAIQTPEVVAAYQAMTEAQKVEV